MDKDLYQSSLPEDNEKNSPRASKPWLIPVCIVLAVVLIALTAFLVFFIKKQNSPEAAFKNTAQALLNGGDKNAFDISTLFGDYTAEFDAALGKDVLSGAVKQPFTLHLSLDHTRKADAVALALGSAEPNLCINLQKCGNDVFLSSEQLTDNAVYSVNLDGISERLDNSPFAPDSNSVLALSEEEFQQFKNFLRFFDPSAAEQEPEVAVDEDLVHLREEFTALLKRVAEAVRANAKKTIEKRDVPTLDGETKVAVTRLSIDKESAKQIFDVVQDAWDDIQDDVIDYIVDEVLFSLKEAGYDTATIKQVEKEYREELTTSFDTAFEEFEKSLDDLGDLYFEYGIKNRYIVYSRARFSYDKSAFELTFTCHQKPSKDPDALLTFDHTDNGDVLEQMILSLTQSYDKKDGSKAFLCLDIMTSSDDSTAYYTSLNKNLTHSEICTDIANDGSFTCALSFNTAQLSKAAYKKTEGNDVAEKMANIDDKTNILTLKIGGKEAISKRQLYVTVDSIRYQMAEEKEKKYEDSVYTLKIKKNTLLTPSLHDSEDITVSSLSAEQLEGLIFGGIEKYGNVADTINNTVGVHVLDKVMLMDPRTHVSIEDWALPSLLYAFDTKTNRLFIAQCRSEYEKDQGKLLVYEWNNTRFSYVETLFFDREIMAMDADNGTLILSFISTLSIPLENNIHFYDAADLTEKEVVTVKNFMASEYDYISNLLLYNNTVFYTFDDQWCYFSAYNTVTKENLDITELSNFHHPAVAIDKRNGTMCIADRGISRTNFIIFDYHNQKKIASSSFNDFNREIPETFGTGYFVQGHGLTADNQEIRKLAQALPDWLKQTFKNDYFYISGINYISEHTVIACEDGDDGIIRTFIFSDDGNKVEANSIILRITPLSDGRFLALRTDGETFALTLEDANFIK